jgi:hypothetical protein
MKRFVFATLLFGCGTTPTPTPTPVPDVTDYSAVCLHLAELGCAEGAAPECAVAFGRIQGGRLGDLQPGCLMGARTREAARACGSVLCE